MINLAFIWTDDFDHIDYYDIPPKPSIYRALEPIRISPGPYEKIPSLKQRKANIYHDILIDPR